MSWLSELLVPWWVKPAIIAVILGLCFTSGWYVEGLRWSKDVDKIKIAAAQQSIDYLKANIKITADALGKDATQALADAQTKEDLERITNELVAKTDDTACFNGNDTDRLRGIFGR